MTKSVVKLNDSKHYWIIGASAGIGKSLAQKLANKGVSLSLSARSKDDLTTLANSLKGHHQVLPFDVTEATEVAQAAKSCMEFGNCDGVIYLAGQYKPMPAQEMNADHMIKTVDVNLNGVIRILGEILPHYLKRNSGHIVITGSIAGYRGLPKAMGYGLSKAATNHLAQNLRVDLANTKVNVQLICPGFVKTRLTDKNEFDMPMIITAEQAGDYIVKGLEKSDFEIHFPKRLTYIFKLLEMLPDELYFPIIKRMVG